MARIRVGLLSLLAVFALCAIASASASAAKLVWYGESGELTEGKHYNVVSHGSVAVLKAKTGGNNVEIDCASVEGKGWVENSSSGGNGLGSADNEFKECAPKGPVFNGCSIPGNKFSLPSVTELVEVSGKIDDRYTPEGSGFAELVLKECENASFDGAYLLSGAYNGAINASVQEFVSTPAELKLFGNSAYLEGSVTEELEGGGRIEVRSITSHPHWYSGATKLKQGEKVNITAHPTHVVMEKVSIAGVSAKIECEGEMSGSWLENPSGGGPGIGHTEIKYSGCTVTGSGFSGCKITATKSYPSSVELVSTGEIELKPELSSFAEFVFGECTHTGLNSEYFITGTDYAWIGSGSKSQFEFNAGLSEGMKWEGNKMKWIGTFEVEKEGGGTILGGE